MDEALRFNGARRLLLGLIYGALLSGQSAFEVASVKLNTSGDKSSYTRRGAEMFALQNWPLRDIVLKAYDLKNYALIGPDWLARRNFDINAKAAVPMDDNVLRQMLQRLLIERFGLKTHVVSREQSGFALVAVKGGPKIEPAHDDGAFGVDVSRFPNRTKVVCRHCTMDSLAGVLGDQLGRAVADESGLSEHYSYTLQWSPNQNAGDTGPSLFTALSEQLGMRLESRRLAVQVMVVDAINSLPTEN